jgi:hypothetical protein
MPASEETWAEVKKACCESDEAVTSIALRFGVPRMEIYRRRTAEAWPMPLRRRPPARTSLWRADGAKPARRKRRAKKNETVRDRLKRLAMRNLDFAERIMDETDGALAPSDQDRVNKMITGAARMLEKFEDGESDTKRAGSATARAHVLSGADVDRMRSEIAERLERVRRRRESEGGSGGA